VDKRADVWAFGCVLYEMLAGEQVFCGTHLFEVLIAIAHLDPDWAALPANLPRPIRALLESCLVRDSRRRIRDMSTVLFLLANCENLAEPVPMAPAMPRTPWWRRIAMIAAATSVIIASAGVPLWFGISGAPSTPAGVRFQIPAPADGPAEMLTLSPDGRQLAFVAPNGGASQVWIRSMSALESRPLAGTNGATYPFWSPDGVSLGYFAQGKLKKIAIAGGLPQTVCDAPNGRGGTWNRNGVILFSAGPRNPIVRVAAAGGMPTPVTRLERESAGHRFPAFLPDGIHFLYSVGDDNLETSGLYLGAVDGTSRVRLLPDETNALYAPPLDGSAIGHLIFRRDGTLMAQRFDPRTLTLSGEMSPIAEDVQETVHDGFGAFSISSNGTLVYRAGRERNRTMQWTDRAGKRVATLGQAAALASSPVISPDQQSVAVVTIANGSQSDIWLHDVRRNLSSRFTFRQGHYRSPIWTADGTRLAFAFEDTYSANIYIRPATGEGAEELLSRGGVNVHPMDWSSDGRWMLYEQQGETTGLDLWLLPLEGDRKPIPYLQTRAEEGPARFRPNASGGPRWMAYSSDESGTHQIYVESIPPGAKYQISTGGGRLPRWRGDGKELFYLAPDGKLMAVGIAAGTSVTPATPSELFADPGIIDYDASADGQRFLVVVPADANAALSPVTVVLGWRAN
jgi:Tol biopolymer transport system component